MTPPTVEDIAVEIRRLGWDKRKIESWVATLVRSLLEALVDK